MLTLYAFFGKFLDGFLSFPDLRRFDAHPDADLTPYFDMGPVAFLLHLLIYPCLIVRALCADEASGNTDKVQHNHAVWFRKSFELVS